MVVDGNARMTPEQQRRRNVRLGIVLASIALVFFVGFILRALLFGA